MPGPSSLPFTVPSSRKSVSASSFRLTEKFILLLIFSAFITFCFGAIFFLPDSTKLLSGVLFRSEPEPRTGTDAASGSGTRKDEHKILAKIRRDHEQALLEAKDRLQRRPEDIKQDILIEKDQVLRAGPSRQAVGVPVLPDLQYLRPPGATGREPTDPDAREKRAKVKEVWTQYPGHIHALKWLVVILVAVLHGPG